MRVSDTVQIGHPQTEVRNPKSRGDDPSIEEDTLSLPLGRGPAAFPHGDMRLGPADRSASRCGTRALPGALPLAPPALARGCCMRGGCGKWREAAREGSQRDVRAVCAQCPAAASPSQPLCVLFHVLLSPAAFLFIAWKASVRGPRAARAPPQQDCLVSSPPTAPSTSAPSSCPRMTVHSDA